MASPFDVSQETLDRIKLNFQQELETSLGGNKRMLKCLRTFVEAPPTGQETGRFLLIDLGGTNLRIGLGELLGNHQWTLQHQTWQVPDEIKAGSGYALFEYIAKLTTDYAKENKVTSSKVGFTFSFPVQQTSIKDGDLLQFTKSYDCHDIIGCNVVQLLQSKLDAIDCSLNLKVEALVNDTVGTLLAHAYKNPATRMAVILGTGTNACYWQKIGEKQMVINIEWGAYGDGLSMAEQPLPITEWDRALDENTEDPGKQGFEKMVSGLYLGELFRLAAAKNLRENYAVTPYSIETKCLRNVKEFLKGDSTEESIVALQSLADSIMTRSAKLSAALICAVALHARKGAADIEKSFVLAIDGSLYAKNPHYADMLNKAVQAMSTSGSNITIETSAGEPLIGSGVVLAAVGSPA